jgi:hypothetical protein
MIFAAACPHAANCGFVQKAAATARRRAPRGLQVSKLWKRLRG